jgi:hypothetical protein
MHVVPCQGCSSSWWLPLICAWQYLGNNQELLAALLETAAVTRNFLHTLHVCCCMLLLLLLLSAGLVKEILPNTHLVALLREPATRALSSINMVIQRGDFLELKTLNRSSPEYARVWQRVVVRELRKEMAVVNACLARVDAAAPVRRQVRCVAATRLFPQFLRLAVIRKVKYGKPSAAAGACVAVVQHAANAATAAFSRRGKHALRNSTSHHCVMTLHCTLQHRLCYFCVSYSQHRPFCLPAD